MKDQQSPRRTVPRSRVCSFVKHQYIQQTTCLTFTHNLNRIDLIDIYAILISVSKTFFLFFRLNTFIHIVLFKLINIQTFENDTYIITCILKTAKIDEC